MYDWRKMTSAEKRLVLNLRRKKKHPAHELPHFSDGQTGIFFVTGTNFEHANIIGQSEKRMDDFSQRILSIIDDANFQLHAYCVMPNHYHFLAEGHDSKILRRAMGKLHGRTSRWWNVEDGKLGRKVWFRVFDRLISTNRQYYSRLNYIHYNPVKAALCKKMTDWEWSSAESFVIEKGREKAIEIWETYPPE